jgi:hypothetical protein
VPPKGSGKWPKTAAEKRDRDRVLKLVYRVGRDRLRFNTYHLRAAAEGDPALALESGGQLHRHLRALEGTTVVQVGVRNGSVAGGAAAQRGKKVYVLKAREGELETAPPELDDLEKAMRALWVAVAALGGAEVPTKAVTAVFRTIEDLAPESRRDTYQYLNSLYRRAAPLVERSTVSGQAIVRWLPIGSPPEDAGFDGWVGQFKALNKDLSAVVASGHATVGGMVEELVEIAILRSRSTTWPFGQPATIRGLETAAGADDRAGELTRLLRRRNTAPSVVLGDLTKETIAGVRRVDRRVVKIQGPLGTGTYYDCPHVPGFERRKLFVQYQALRYTITTRQVGLLAEELAQGSHLENHEDVGVRACGVVRILGVHQEVEAYDAALRALEQSTPLLSKTIRESLVDYRRRLDSFTRSFAAKEELTDVANSLLTPLGLSLDEVLEASRPLIVAAEYASWFAPHHLRGLNAADFLARAVSLSRYPNPRHTQRSDSDPRKAAATCVDRVEAMRYAASYVQTPILDLLQAGYGLLGRFLRHPRLVAAALDSPRADLRRAALGALVLLGDPAAAEASWQELDRPRSPNSLVDALYALVATDSLELARIPAAVRQTTDRYVQSVLRQIVRAAHQNRPLLQTY